VQKDRTNTPGTSQARTATDRCERLPVAGDDFRNPTDNRSSH
jgi:hypothetical protein